MESNETALSGRAFQLSNTRLGAEFWSCIFHGTTLANAHATRQMELVLDFAR
jgi:hypothetical protein